jgi:hypothetical protein
MIVLDEQLLGRGIEAAIAHWYRGAVRLITDLRPGTVIKDDATPALLRREARPTFVTINEADFWRKVAITEHFVSSVSHYRTLAQGRFQRSCRSSCIIQISKQRHNAWGGVYGLPLRVRPTIL